MFFTLFFLYIIFHGFFKGQLIKKINANHDKPYLVVRVDVNSIGVMGKWKWGMYGEIYSFVAIYSNGSMQS
jgi:hypothetical protein